MRVLHLTLKKQWFDMIASSVKRHEYREIKPYWDKRLNKPFDVVIFKNGYGKNSPSMTVELKCIYVGLGLQEWGAPADTSVYILALGKILEINQ